MHVLTGTWEEIKTHEAELAGHRVVVTVEDTDDEAPEIQARLAALEAWVSLPRPSHAVVLDDSRAAIYGEDPDRG